MVEDGRGNDIDVLDWVGRVAFEAVCQAAVGHSFNAINDPNGHPYCRALKDFVYVYLICVCTLSDAFLGPLSPPSRPSLL